MEPLGHLSTLANFPIVVIEISSKWPNQVVKNLIIVATTAAVA